MLDRLARAIYEKLGHRYRLIFFLAEEGAALGVAALAVYLIASYYEPSRSDLLFLLVTGWIFTGAAIGWALWRGNPYLERVVAWQNNSAPSIDDSVAAWDAATNFPIRSFRANSLTVSAIAAAPMIALMALRLDLPWSATPVLLAAILLPVGYATVLNYFIAELIMRPVIEDIASVLPDDFPFEADGLLIRKRLKILLPIFTAWVGFVVAALMTGNGGTPKLAWSVAAAVVVGMFFSFELTVLLSRSVTAPIAALRRGVASVRAGDFDARVPVVTSDELGELSHDFNLMAAGLSERERMREAFGTYLDRDIVQLILSGQFPKDGVEVTASIMFVDVRGFTTFAERSEATEVVAALNELFETIVPIVSNHGGHVDKFLGDGLLAIFGPPEGYARPRGSCRRRRPRDRPDRQSLRCPAGRGRHQYRPRGRRLDRRGRPPELQRHRRRRQRGRPGRGRHPEHRRRPADHPSHERCAPPRRRAAVTRHRRSEGQGRAGGGSGLHRRRRSPGTCRRGRPAPGAVRLYYACW